MIELHEKRIDFVVRNIQSKLPKKRFFLNENQIRSRIYDIKVIFIS